MPYKHHMPEITPHLWFDKEAKNTVGFYVSVFPDSKITHTAALHNVPTPTGECDLLSFELSGQPFMAINAGPLFKFNPSISFLVVQKTTKDVDELWAKLSKGGSVLMELGEYPFSKKFGWTSDRYGLSWQVMLDDGHYPFQRLITPTLMFVGNVAGRAEEAMKFYASIFPESKVGDIARYPAGMEPEKEGTVKHGSVFLTGQEIFAMDSAREHKFSFNEAISLLIPCEDQKEIDFYWDKLSADPKSEQCGWLKDKFGVSWQVWPTIMGEMMKNGTREQLDRVTQAFLPMRKFDLAALRKAYEGQ
jgi:predicted 3-demethylubiquinone-9 3-methyltransferase (glyoxalase superfamily)